MKRTLGVDPGQHSIGLAVFESDGICSYCAQLEDPTDRTRIEEKFLAAREVVGRIIDKFKIEQVSYEIAKFGQREPVLYGLVWILRIEFLRRKLRYVQFGPNQWYSIAYKGADFEVLDKKRAKALLAPEESAALEARYKAWTKRTGKIETCKLVAHELGIDYKFVGTDACDAYFVAKIGQRFWAFVDGELKQEDLRLDEQRQFLWKHTYVRGKNAGKSEEGGMLLEKAHAWFPSDHVSQVNIKLNQTIDTLGVSKLFGG